MNKNKLALLIHRYKNGQASLSEMEFLENYWKQALEDTSLMENLSFKERDELKNGIYSEIKRQIKESEERKVIPMAYTFHWFHKVAAAILLLCAITAIFFWNSQRDIEVITRYGERLTVKLPDQSSIILNGNSKLRYPGNWSSQKDREVWIDGEGFFEVQHTTNHQKFVVHTSEGLSVEVLGTKFNVKSRQQKAEVLLTEGKVKLNLENKGEDPIYLQPGELATMKEKQLTKSDVKNKRYTSWIESKLFFDKTPLLELAEILEQTYGLQVSFQNDVLKNLQLSGEISSATADDILFAIAETFNIDVKREGTTVVLSSKH